MSFKHHAILLSALLLAPTLSAEKSSLDFDLGNAAEVLLQEKPEKSAWTGNILVGASQSSGNSNVTQATVSSRLEWKISEKQRAKAGFDWLYATEKNQTTLQRTLQQRRTSGFAQYDHFLSKRLFAYGRVDAAGDAKQNLILRVVPGAGFGYQIQDEEKVKWSVEAGLSYTYEDFKTLSPEEYWALRIATAYHRKVTATLDYDFTLEWLPSLENSEDQLATVANQFTAKLGEGFVGSLRWEMDYDNTPPAGNDRLDHRVILSVGYSF